MPCWSLMFLTIFHQVVITTLLWNSTIHLGIKNTLWWRNYSVKKCFWIKKWNFISVPTRLWVNWNLCGITSTWRARWRAWPTRWWPRPGAQAWSQQALNISLRLWRATQDLKPSIRDNHTGAMYDIYSVIPEEKRSLVNSPILQMKAIKNEVVALTIWMFLFSFFMTLFYHRWRWMVWWRQWWNDGTIWKFLYKKRYSTGGGEWDDGGPRKG